ncbi:MAG: ATP-binding protein [Faecousia sp.]
MEAVWYPLGLCAGVGILALAVDYIAYARRHRTLRSLAEQTEGIEQRLPEAKNVLEGDYQELVRTMSRERLRREEELNGKYRDMVDYYTLWAHQIKTPIASMGLQLQSQDTPLARQLSVELARIQQYVEMVLVFLRLDSESTDYVFREYALDEIVRRSLRSFAGEFISRKLKLCYTPMELTVVTDEKWLSFVVEQVLSNALKYTPEGSVSIYTEESSTLCIRDTGIGIAAEDLPRVFEKSFTGCQGRADHRASGIGLYLCKQICDRLGHTIRAESKVGEGTVIRIGLEQTRVEAE